MPKRSGKTVQLNVSIPENLKPILVKAAEKEGRSLSNLVSCLLQRAMKELVWKTNNISGGTHEERNN